MNNFLSYQISKYKSLVDLSNYKFTSLGNSYSLLEMIKNQINRPLNYKEWIYPNLKTILEEKIASNLDYFKNNFSSEYSDVFYNADKFEEVANNYVKLYYAYVIYELQPYSFTLGKIDFEKFSYIKYIQAPLDFDITEYLDLENSSFIFNPNLRNYFRYGNISSLNEILSFEITNKFLFENILKKLSFCDLELKDKNRFVLTEIFKSIYFNQAGVEGFIPLQNFAWGVGDEKKQIEYNFNYGSIDNQEIVDATTIQNNNKSIKSLIDKIKDIEDNKIKKNGTQYIEKINKKSICSNNILFYALSSINLNSNSGSSPKFLKTNIQLILDKNRTITAIVDGYDFIYSMLLITKSNNEEFCDIFLDSDEGFLYLISNNKISTKLQTGFDPDTYSPIYDYLDLKTIIKLPIIKNEYANIVQDCWLYSYSSSSTIREIIEFEKETGEEMFKINIPTEFLNQKDIITQEQLLKIDTIQNKLEKSKLQNVKFLDKFVDLCREYVLTYSDEISQTLIDESSKEITTYTYVPKNLPDAMLYGNVSNYDYVWKVNELFWKYNKSITIRELIAYFVAKGDSYNYRLLSYRILGVDCYVFKNQLLEQLLLEGLVFIEEFAINLKEKSIEKPIKISYRYEYAAGNYYNKKSNFNLVNQYSDVLNIKESILAYFGDINGEKIVQNHLQFLDSEFIKPKEMMWSGKGNDKLMCAPTDPIFINDLSLQQIKLKGTNYETSIYESFQSYIEKSRLLETDITKEQLLYSYILRLPEAYSIPLAYIQSFNCFKINVLPKDNTTYNDKGQDVYAVFGYYDLLNEVPLYISDDTTNDSYNQCERYIKAKPYGGALKIQRKQNEKGDDDGTYSFNSSLTYLENSCLTNLYEGKFITFDEYSNWSSVSKLTKKKIVNEVLIHYNQLQSKTITEGDYQFNSFMSTQVDEIDALKIQQVWNETYNYEMYPKKMVKPEGFDEYVWKLNNDKFPIFVEHSKYFGTDTKNEFSLHDNQIDGIKFYVGNKNSGLLAHEVGFGKTSTSICSLSHQLLTGEANRIMITVPNPVYVNFIREIKGDKAKDGLTSRGLTPNINLVELKNARRNVFLTYDLKTFTQKSGIKKYSKNQIINIHNFKNVVNEINKKINPTKGKYEVLYIDDYDMFKSNVLDFRLFVESVFDKKLLDWRLEDYFSTYMNEIYLIVDENRDELLLKFSILESEANRKKDKIDNSSRMSDDKKAERKSKINDELNKEKNKAFFEFCKKATVSISSFILSGVRQIYDRIGAYSEEFLRNNTIVMCIHDAIGQMRISRQEAISVSMDIKDNYKLVDSLSQNSIGFEKLNIDSIVVDEVHNFNKLFTYAKKQIADFQVEKGEGLEFFRGNYRNLNYLQGISNLYFAKKRTGGQRNSVVKFNIRTNAAQSVITKATLFGICKTIRNKNFFEQNPLLKGRTSIPTNLKRQSKRGVLLLSATPFVDDLFQMISVFNMLSDFETPIEFFSNFLYQNWDWENDHKGQTVLKAQSTNFKNDDARNNWVRLFSQFYTFDPKINKKRPNKFTYPYDCKSNNIVHYVDNCETRVYLDFTNEQQKIYENIGKYVEGTITKDEIVPSVMGQIKNSGVFITEDVMDYVLELADPNHEDYNPDNAAQIFAENDWIEVLDDDKHEYYEQVKSIYKSLKDEINELIGKKDEEEEDDDLNNNPTISGIGNQKGGQRALSGQISGKMLALSPYMVTPIGASDGYINPDLPPLYGVLTPENKYASAINFVETSPKLYFICESIKCLIEHHIEKKENITGQIIYINMSKFTYGGVKYEAMDLIKSYLEEKLKLKQKYLIEEYDDFRGVKRQYNLSEVQIVSGAIQDPLYKSAISSSFNDGKIKVLIGTSTIKEGINLQGNEALGHGNSTIYVATSDYAPMVYMQLEGRIWRQKNPLENVRIVYPLIKNSIDLHIYSKVKEKISKVKNMLEAGIYSFKETQFDKDIEGVSLALNSNINEKLKVIWSKESRMLEEEKKKIDIVIKRYEKVKDNYLVIKQAIGHFSMYFNAVSKALQDYYAILIMKDMEQERRLKIIERYSNLKNDYLATQIAKYEKDLEKYEIEKEKNQKENEENKKKKLPPIEFNLEKPLKKNYEPDYTELSNKQAQDIAKSREEIQEIVLKKIEEKKYPNINDSAAEDAIYYHEDIDDNTSYSQFMKLLNNFLSNTRTVYFDEIEDYKSYTIEVAEKGNYWAFAGTAKSKILNFYLKKTFDDYGFYKEIVPPITIKIMTSGGMGISTNLLFQFRFFDNLVKSYIKNLDVVTIMSDYQDLLYSKGKDIADITLEISDLEIQKQNYTDRILNKSEFIENKRLELLEEEERIRKERENLTDMKQYVGIEVNKFCKTNKFIYIRGSLTEIEKEQMFQIKV